MVDLIIENTVVRIMPHAGYRNKYAGEIGVVERNFLSNQFSRDKKIGIRLNNHTNKLSQYGVFWFDEDKLEIIESCESEEFEMLGNYKIALIKFLDGTNTDHVYPYALYEDLQVDDFVVVQTGHHGLAIAQIAAIETEESNIGGRVECGREVVAKVDFTAFNERKEKAKRLAQLKKDMDKKVKELQSIALYEMLADKDPALKELLDEFKTLSE